MYHDGYITYYEYNRFRNRTRSYVYYMSLFIVMIIDFSHLAFLRYYELIKEDSDFYIICY